MRYTILIILTMIASCFYREPTHTGLEGKQLPSFGLLLPDSTDSFDMKNVPMGRPSVVFLFSPFCPYSKAQMKDIIENIKRLQNLHFYVITPFPYKDMKSFSNQYRLQDYKNITIGSDTANFYPRYTGAVEVPFLAIYDKKKRLIKAFSGKMDVMQIKQIADADD